MDHGHHWFPPPPSAQILPIERGDLSRKAPTQNRSQPRATSQLDAFYLVMLQFFRLVRRHIQDRIIRHLIIGTLSPLGDGERQEDGACLRGAFRTWDKVCVTPSEKKSTCLCRVAEGLNKTLCCCLCKRETCTTPANH